MKQPIFTSNTPIDEKRISFIEKVVTRLARRASIKTLAIIPPYPISNCVIGDDVRGEVLRYMFCVGGVVNKAIVVLGEKPKQGTVLSVTIEGNLVKHSKSFTLLDKKASIDLELEVEPEHRIIVSIGPIDQEEKITEVWIAFTWTPNVEEVKVKSIMFDELEEMDVLEE